MESEVSFKVYYLDEIRRFALKASAREPLSYAGLAQRVQAVFDIAPTLQLRLRWLDPEGDRIVFNSSEELADAVRLLTAAEPPAGGAVRIYATTTTNSTDGGAGFDPSGIVHPGVYCDGCNSGPIRGYRFKCLMCPDYDLCLGCLNRDVHSQHQMTLLRRPGERHHGWGGGWGGGGGGWGGHHHPMMRRCHRMRDAQATAAGAATVVNSGAATGAAPETASVGTDQELIEHVTSAINTFLRPLGIDASIQVTRQEADAGVQAATPASPTAEAAIKASLLTEATRVQLSSSQFSTAGDAGLPQQPPPPPPQAESSVVFRQQTLDSSTASFESTTGAAAAAADYELVAEPKIARALEHMTAMGFNDEGGWLTRLLTAKDGDICAVLDAIRPAGGAGGSGAK